MSRSGRGTWIGVWLAVVVCAGCGPEVTIPTVDLTRSPPAIAEDLRQARQSVEDRPQSALAWGRLGQKCMAHQFSHEALACLEQAARLAPKEGRWPYLAALLLEERDLRLAVEHCGIAIQRAPQYPAAYYRRGVWLARLGKVFEASEMLEAAARLAPQHPAPGLALARLAMGQREWPTALARLKKVLQLAPSSRAVLWELSRCAAWVGESDRSEEYRRRAESALPGEPTLDDPWLMEVAALELAGQTTAERADSLIRAGQLAAGEKVLRQLVHEHPELPRGWLNLATVQTQQGQLEDATASFTELIRRFPKDPTGYIRWARLSLATNHVAKARNLLKDAIRLKNDSAEAEWLLGLIAEHDGAFDEAETHFHRAVHSAPHWRESHLALARLLGKRGQTAEAREVLQRAAFIGDNASGLPE